MRAHLTAVALVIALLGCDRHWQPSPPAGPPVVPPSPMAPPDAAATRGPSPAPQTSAETAPKRFDFNGDIPGVMTLKEFSKKYKARPPEHAVESHPSTYTVDTKLSIATKPVRTAIYEFFDGRLREISLSIDGVDEDRTIRDGLEEKYGPPTRNSDSSCAWENSSGWIHVYVQAGQTGVFFSDAQTKPDSAGAVRKVPPPSFTSTLPRRLDLGGAGVLGVTTLEAFRKQYPSAKWKEPSKEWEAADMREAFFLPAGLSPIRFAAMEVDSIDYTFSFGQLEQIEVEFIGIGPVFVKMYTKNYGPPTLTVDGVSEWIAEDWVLEVSDSHLLAKHLPLVSKRLLSRAEETSE